jgi:hypothetical protein
MQQQPQNRPAGSLRRGNQCSGPRLAMDEKAPHRHPRLDTRNTAALIRRPVSHARGGVFLLFCAESTGTSDFAALPVAACSDQLGAGTFFARHVTIAGRSAGGIVSGFESCGARLSSGSVADRERHRAVNAAALPSGGSIPPRPTIFARRVAGQPSTVLGSAVAGGARGAGRRWLLSVGTRSGHSHTRASRATNEVARTEKRTLRSENGDGLTRAHSHTGVPRPVPPTLLPLAASSSRSHGAGRAFFFAGVA